MKYRDRFEELEEFGNVSMGRFLLSEVLTKMADTCKNCQRDRMRCTLRPMCPDRIFLNILITLGAKDVDLPSFCYQVHVRALQSYLKAGAKRTHSHEPRYPLRYFHRFVQFKKDDPEGNFLVFKEWLEKTTKARVHGYAQPNKWFFGVGNGIFIIDLKRELVSLDPDGDIVKRETLEPLLTFKAQLNGIKFKILKDLQDTWYLRVKTAQFPPEQSAEVVEPRLDTLRESWAFVRTNNIEKEMHILVGLDPAPDLIIRLHHIRELIQLIAEIVKAAPKEKTKSSNSSEKPSQTVKPVAKARS